ncbi:hypothetical protein HH212_00060 [Massilia forsythiae]|uniref:Uncharacterized protein n=1 Tax=Massilia forsythiae TaxID=2728020 RepID=A0A7Z2ZS26_9BURK|nr:hypothetical protein [Massilia forsythiae]QJD98631.1 hypothetical protein HH212_00060 [Massilia forsythiae]
MSNPNAKNISVKGYLSPDVYLAMKAVFDPMGLSMSTAIGLGLQQLSASMTREADPAHRTRRQAAGPMPKAGPVRARVTPASRQSRGGAPKPFLRV